MDDRKVYTDINRIINAYVVKEDEQPNQQSPEVQRAAQDREDAAQDRREASEEELQAALRELEVRKKDLTDRLNTLRQTQSEDHKPGEDYEYDYEGSMAKTQLTQITQAAEKLMSGMKEDENLPEWVQSKIAVACDYMIKVASYLDATEEQDNQAMEKKPAIQMPNLPKPPAVSSMMSSALGSKPMVGFSMGGSSSPSNQDHEGY
jgi:hypothetical protein